MTCRALHCTCAGLEDQLLQKFRIRSHLAVVVASMCMRMRMVELLSYPCKAKQRTVLVPCGLLVLTERSAVTWASKATPATQGFVVLGVIPIQA